MAMAMWARDRLYLAVLCGGAPTDDEWSRWVALGVRRNGQQQRVLIESRGGGPTAKQRQAILSANKADVRIAVMTDSTVVRGIVTAVAWFGVALRAVPLNRFEAAATYLELTPEELATAIDMFPKLRLEASINDTAQRPAAPD